MDFYKILEERGLSSLLRVELYNYVDFENSHTVYSVLDSLRSEPQKRVLIYGDYDVDGLMFALIARDFVRSIGCKNYEVFRYEHRTHELDKNAVRYCIQNHFNYFIIGDTASSDMDSLKMLRSYGIQVIVLDHHNTRYNYSDYPDSGDSNITEPVAPVLEEDNETATISNLQKVEQKSRTSKISALAVAAMIAISIISGAAFGISKKLGDVNYRIKQSITENESTLAEVKAESEKLSVLNYDSILIGDLLSIKVNGCIGYVSMNSEEIEILYYLRDEKSAKTLEDKLTNYKVASIEKSGTLKVEDTECLKYTVKIERSTL